MFSLNLNSLKSGALIFIKQLTEVSFKILYNKLTTKRLRLTTNYHS